jgi:glycosyltransferase involved in cell wall biosynthesis
LKWAEKESVKTRYSGGREYFIFAGDIDERHCLLTLLKAFSQFKKWQQSNMQLILAGHKTGWTEKLVEKISSFKYRDDVHLMIDPSKQTLNTLIGCAYAFLYPALHDYLPVNILRAMRAGIPVITSNIPVIYELAADTVVYSDAANTETLARSIQLIYKDEKYRAELIDSAKKQLEKRGSSNLSPECWNFLQQA